MVRERVAYEEDEEAGLASERTVLQVILDLIGHVNVGAGPEVDTVLGGIEREVERTVVLIHAGGRSAPFQVQVNDYTKK